MTRKRLSLKNPDVILKRNRQNILKLVKEGKAVTDRQLALLLQGDGSAAPLANAKNYVALAEACGVTRQTIHKYARRKDCPKAAANGTHDIVAWKLYLAKQGATDDPERLPDEKTFDIEIKHLRAALLSIELAERKKETMSRAEHLEKIGAIARAFRRALDTIVARISAVTRDPKMAEAVRKECESASQLVRDELGASSPEPKPGAASA